MIGGSKPFDQGEKWYADTFRVWAPPGFLQAVEVDMTRSRDIIDRLREGGVRATYTHLFVRSVAIALTRHPRLHQIVTGDRRRDAGRVDVCLAVSGHDSFAPTRLIIEDAGSKDVVRMAREIATRAALVKGREPSDFPGLRRWGWLVPSTFMRRAILRRAWRQPAFLRRNAGTFTVTCLPDVDLFASFTYATAAAACLGQVKDRVVAVGREPMVRLTALVSCCADHVAWNGIQCSVFLNEIRAILTGDELEEEAVASCG